MSNYNKLALIPRELLVQIYKKGSKIHIKESNKGKFTDYCGGKVTQDCIAKGKNSPNPVIRKRANFAANARKWKHQNGGLVQNTLPKYTPVTMQDLKDKQEQEYNNFLQSQVYQQIQQQQIKQQKQQLLNNHIDNAFNSISGLITQGVQNYQYNQQQRLQAEGQNMINKLSPEMYSALVKGESIQAPEGSMLGFSVNQDGSVDFHNEYANSIIQQAQNKYKQDQQQKALVSKKGGKVHKPFGHKSVLDDTGVVNEKTLKLK